MPSLWDLPECQAFKSEPFGVLHASQSWHWFFLQQQIIKEAFIGIALSLSFAAVVLVLFIGLQWLWQWGCGCGCERGLWVHVTVASLF